MRKSRILLAFCLITALLFSPLWGMDDHGANVVVTNKDGTLARGELIAIKWDALVISADESSPLEYTSIAIKDINNVEVIKESKVGKGMLLGILIGGGIGAAGGLNCGNIVWAYYGTDKALAMGLYGSVLGFMIGTVVGAIASTHKRFFFENLSKEGRDAALLKLSDYAAIKGVR